MLNPFPELLMLSFFIPMILRITVAAVFAYLAIAHFKNKKEVAKEISFVSHEVAVWGVGVLILIELAVAVGLFVGFWTQVAAIVGVLLCLKPLLRKGLHILNPLSRLSYILVMVMCLTLIISGAGIFAFDIPL